MPTDACSPCHCGSGKKYKFCCMKADRSKPKAEPAHGPECGCPIDHDAHRAIRPKPADAQS